MAESYLPKLKGGIGPPQTHGRWEEKPILLSGLANDLEIDEIPETTSVPSIWARALVFEEALTDTQHPQHDAIENEWRGLMGIFCFRDCFGLKLTHERIILPKKDKIDEYIKNRNIKNKNQQMAIKRFINSLILQKPDDWPDQIYLVKVDGILIAGSCPESLFFTPPEYKCSNFVPWCENGRLYDPFKWFNEIVKFDEEKEILKRWIDITKDYLQGKVGSDVIKPFDDWLGEMDNIPLDTTIIFQSGGINIPAPYEFTNKYFSWEE